MAWHGGLQPPSFESAFGGVHSEEDWEDWLRWDPVADSRSPDHDGSHSGSSKNDSPIAIPPVELHFNGISSNDTLAPPLIVGEHGLDAADPDMSGIMSFGADIHDHNDFTFEPASHTFANLPKHAFEQMDWTDPQASTQSGSHTSSALSTLHIPTVTDNSSSGPPTATTPSVHNSPSSTADKRTSVSSFPSPAPAKKRGGGAGGRKRKLDVEADNDNDNDKSNSEDGDGPPVKKTSHNVIEKRYRNNLNDKIVELRDSVPSLRALYKPKPADASEDLEGLTAAHKHNKATIMAKATEYIRHLEKRNRAMQDDMDALKAKLASVEAAFTKTRSRQGSIASPPVGTVRPMELTSGPSMNSYLTIPQTQQVHQQQYMSQPTSPAYARPPNPPVDAQNTPAVRNGRGSLANKIMLGGMAGLMLVEGLGQDQSGDIHGLGMLPGFSLIKRSTFDTAFDTSAALRHPAMPLLKVFFIVSALLYLIIPLFTASPKKKQPLKSVMRLPQAPSLASPVEVRRKAWLTAIQTVWVPKHFLLEVVTVLSKMFKMFLRRVFGMKLFGSFTDVNKDDEVARIKAWDIAIDAQLAGGDAEVSYYRLLLTLMASGTLPDSPTRLMQKAVHFRVFFWEVANAGYGNLTLFKQFTEKVGHFYWESARRQQRELVHARANNFQLDDTAADPLPDHLASLLELDCDEVLSDEMIQRAWNLAWNKPSDNAVISNAARDFVVLDHAIRSPLDAVAAWYSNMLIDETIAETFGSTGSRIDMEYYLHLAVSVAPPASSTQSRALTTKATLSRSNRHANITAALNALPAASPASPSMNLVAHEPASPEVRAALIMAKLMALSTQLGSIASARASVNEILSQFAMPPQAFSLLTAVAAYQLLHAYGDNKHLDIGASHGLEDLACSLRVWTGTAAGRQAGLNVEERAAIVERCLDIAKTFGGWSDGDSGYASHSPSKTGSPLLEKTSHW